MSYSICDLKIFGIGKMILHLKRHKTDEGEWTKLFKYIIIYIIMQENLQQMTDWRPLHMM